jgi:acyl-CoA thioester hydrolase
MALPYGADRPVPAPLQLYDVDVAPDWVDYNDHLSEWAYLLIFGDNADAFFRFIGIDDAYRAGGYSLYTAETHLRHLREVKLGQNLRLTLLVLGHDAKRVHILHEMFTADGGLVATAEQMLLHVDMAAGRVAPFGGQLAERLDQIAAAHSALATPSYVGRPIHAVSGEARSGEVRHGS